MAEPHSEPEEPVPGGATPGRPKESGSRQQTHPDQTSHSGSPPFDREATHRGGSPSDVSKPGGG